MLSAVLICIGLCLILGPLVIRKVGVPGSDVQARLEAAARKADRVHLDLWRTTISRGACYLSLVQDQRVHLLTGDVTATNARGTISVYPLRDDVEAWCRASLRGTWTLIPVASGLPMGGIAFEHDSDRVAFKLRWY